MIRGQQFLEERSRMNDVSKVAQPVQDQDPDETREWVESIDSVLKAQGPERAHFLLEKLSRTNPIPRM
jgi:pyruvate dehydrogenase E1 component